MSRRYDPPVGRETPRVSPPKVISGVARKGTENQVGCILSMSTSRRQSHYVGVFWQLRFQVFSTGKAAEIVTCDLAPGSRKADHCQGESSRGWTKPERVNSFVRKILSLTCCGRRFCLTSPRKSMISLDLGGGGILPQHSEFPKRNERFSRPPRSPSKFFRATFPPQSEASDPKISFVNLRALRGE